MAPPNLATQTRLVAQGHQRNVVPFDNRRRSPIETHPGGVVVRLPLPAGSRTLESRTGGDRLSPIDCIVVSLLFLSTLAMPGLVWALVSI